MPLELVAQSEYGLRLLWSVVLDAFAGAVTGEASAEVGY